MRPSRRALHQIAVAEQTQLVTDRRDREFGEGGEIADAELLGDREGVEDLEAGRIGEGRKEPAQTLDGLLGQRFALDKGHLLGIDLVDGAKI